MTAEPSGDGEGGQTTPTQQQPQQRDQNHLVQGRVLSLPTNMSPAVNAAVAGRRASSPLSLSKPPASRAFPPPSSQPLGLATASHSSKASSRFSDAFVNLSGRNRTLSSASKPRDNPLAKELVLEDGIGDSSFGIDADPFASHYSTSVAHTSHSAADSSLSSTPFNAETANRRQRGSLLFAASDALGYVGASISRRMGKRGSVEHSSQSQLHLQHRKGLPWKGKAKSKGHWALQPSSSAPTISDVIEISAAKAGSISIRDEEEENERRERERLREAAAESIGISPLFREDASSRLTGNDSTRFEDESLEGDGSKECNGRSLDDDPAESLRNLDRSWTSINGSMKPNGFPNGSQLQQLQTKENRHQRSSSLSGVATPTTPSSSNWPLPPLGGPPVLHVNSNGRTLVSPAVQSQLPTFPSLLAPLDPFIWKTSTLLKHFPSSPLLILGFSRQWRTRFIVMTSPPQPKSPLVNGFRPFASSERQRLVCHLHLFKSSAPDERELERLEINENSVVFVAEEEIAGKRSVVKVAGVDVGARKKESNTEESGQTTWLLSIADSSEAQNWIEILKSTVLDQRAERAGFGMPTYSTTTAGPKGDLDVMLSLRAQDIASTVRSHAPADLKPPATLREQSRAASPTPTVRSWTGDIRSSSPSGRMVSLKGLFSVPSRTRSLSQGTTPSDHSPNLPEEPPSFTSRGSTLLNMIRPSNGDSVSASAGPEVKSASASGITTVHTLPGPILPTAPILSAIDMNLDRVSLKERDRELPEWYSIQNRQHNKGDSSLYSSSALLPPPRSRRAWTSAGIVTSTKQAEDSTFLPRRSFQDNVSLIGGRLSVDEKRRSHSPAGSFGTATGAFGMSEVGSKRTSLSSSVSSFVSPPTDRDQAPRRSSSTTQHRMRTGRLPKMLTPPAGPPPSVPDSQSQLAQPTGSSSTDNNNALSIVGDRPASRSSSFRSNPNSDVMQNGTMRAGRRWSESSAFSAGSAGTSHSRVNALNTARHISSSTMSPKRASVPPPPRPAPTFALPPTPSQSASMKQSSPSHRRASFRESFSHRSLRFSLTPPPTKGLPPRPDEATIRRRSFSSGISASKHASSSANVCVTPPVPPPTGPLPPTPPDLPVPNRYSFRERLRMKSAPSTPPLGMLRGTAGPPTSFPGSPPLVTVSSVASLKDTPHSPPIGEPITAIPKDLNFLNMSSPVEGTAPSNDDMDFLNMSSPLTGTFPKLIPPRSSELPPPEHVNGSPPSSEMTVLPPPPRRGRNGTISEKDRNQSSRSLSSPVVPAMTENITPISPSLETAI
ncbi:hypothetical protein M0805_003166 [Coniferiporia weirii]|nr:hypothetical protein M0805_003166 [Coniferiporia weirii]